MKSLFAALLISAALPAFAGGLGTMTEEERKAFRDEVRQYLLDNPEVLMEAMDVLKAREEAAAASREVEVLAAHADVFFKAPGDWVGGNPDGDVTVVEFLDYRCGYCRKAWQEVEELVKSDGNIRFVMKEFPILGEDSVISARFAAAVLQLHGGEAYKTVHDKLITLKGQPDEATLSAMATELGLDPAPILTAMSGEAVTELLKGNHAAADLLEISGTPTFIIGNQVIRGYLPLDSLRAIVAEARKKG